MVLSGMARSGAHSHKTVGFNPDNIIRSNQPFNFCIFGRVVANKAAGQFLITSSSDIKLEGYL